jgi:hypothetical protein
MEQERTLERRQTQASAPSPIDAGESELLRQALGWSAVAHEAYDALQKGAEAMRELELRRNESGQ